MYAWAVYHHKIQQAAAGLRVAIVDALANAGTEVQTFLSDIQAIAAGGAPVDAVERFADYDDAWWIELLRKRLRDGVDPRVEPRLALFTRRRPGPVSLWKRASEFPQPHRAAWNARLPERDDLELRKEWERVRTELRGEHVLVERLPFRPWRADSNGESQLKIRTDPQPMPLTRLSSLVRALHAAWTEELQILAFADAPGRMQAAEVLEGAALLK